MGQLIAVILNIMVMLLVPLGLLQVHTVVQARNELLEVSAAATKYVSNHGGTSEGNLQQEVRALIARELREKKFSIPDQDLSVSVIRTRSFDPVLWSHEDEFVVELAIPYPRFTSWIPMPADSLQVQRIGTVNIMDYDL
ncbi:MULTISPECIES: hypothetical protein [Brevibacillus]|uniref:hypothetical protein n=1 Tax=Brevibacillus TaxID=55080 RepID=UPI000D10D915|nr:MULTISPECIES: hypothetical protein [Brevibacillus]PSJ67229.1 hypothetical protein C7J99_21725 [Brevibacillus brevis]RED21016.1 hypothetical protein DES34_12428 [Brevibacillus brevis]TQK41993.1 hypothetical protein FB479_11694 [Brevibacillus sp. AG162]VEF86500.1 Uncharacterised protein [Brevibacillus brevis]GEC93226.1 hypothetical protein BBR01nite_55570 [Brevibacillus brevis]